MQGTRNGSPLSAVPRYSNSATITSGSAISCTVMLAGSWRMGGRRLPAEKCSRSSSWVRSGLSSNGENGCSGKAAQGPRDLREAVGVLLRRAQEAGAVRPEVRLDEVYALLVGVSRAVAHLRLNKPVRSRALGIIFDGLACGERWTRS